MYPPFPHAGPHALAKLLGSGLPGRYTPPPAALSLPVGPRLSGAVGYHPRVMQWPATLVTYQGIAHSIGNMVKLVQSPRGSMSPKVRFLTEWICELVTPKDYLSEILAIRYWVNQHVPYFRDPKKVEWMRDPEALVDAIAASPAGVVRADCDEVAMLCCSLWSAAGHDASFVTVGFQPKPAPASHVFGTCTIPKSVPKTPIVLDPVAGTREAYMLPRVAQFDVYPLS